MLGVQVQMDETNRRVCLFQMDDLERDSSLKDVEPCLEFLIGKGDDVDDAKCFHQICNLKQFVESYLQDKKFIKLPMHKK